MADAKITDPIAYQAAVAEALRQRIGRAAHVPLRIYRDCFIRSLPIADAVDEVERYYVNQLSERARTALFRERDGR